MIVATTNNVENGPIGKHLGVISGEAVIGVNLVKDMFARISDVVGRWSGTYGKELARHARLCWRS